MPNISTQNDDVQDVEARWDQALLSASDMPSDLILQRIVQVKITRLCSASDSVGFVRSKKKTLENNEQPSYTRLKTAVKLQIDLMMRTRNFRVWNEVVERRSVTKSQKKKEGLRRDERGRLFSVEGTWTMFERRLM